MMMFLPVFSLSTGHNLRSDGLLYAQFSYGFVKSSFVTKARNAQLKKVEAGIHLTEVV